MVCPGHQLVNYSSANACVSLKFFSLSTGLPHPLAIDGRAVLPIPARFHGYGMNFVRVCGRGLFFFRYRDEPLSGMGDPHERAYELMDWQTGHTLSVCYHSFFYSSSNA